MQAAPLNHFIRGRGFAKGGGAKTKLSILCLHFFTPLSLSVSGGSSSAMAEARQAVAFQFAVTEDGVKIHFDGAAVKSAGKALFDFTKSRVVRAHNAVLQGIFPASPLSLVVIGGAVVGATYFGKDISLGLNNWILSLLE